MSEMTMSEVMERYGPSEIEVEDVLTPDDPAFRPEHVAIVTGAANGIGRATAIALAVNGLSVLGVDADTEGLFEVQERLQALRADGTFLPMEANLTCDEDIESAVESASTHGSVRYLANIAGIQHIDPIERFPLDVYDEMHSIMQRAPLALTRECWPHFTENPDGGVVGNMCSVHGHIVTRDKVAYNMVKFGLRGLTQSIAAEGGGNIRAFSVSTGYVKTELVAKQLPDTADQRGMTIDEVVEKVLLGQTRVKELMEPIEVANLFVQGFSRHGDHLNGGDLTYDGGMSATY